MKKVQDNAYKQYIKSRPLAKSIMIKFTKDHIISNSSLSTQPLLGILTFKRSKTKINT
jgi:hypothetical protein